MNKFMKLAKEEAFNGYSSNEGGPFGAVITDKNGNIIVLKYQSIFRLLIITINNADTIGTITFSLLIFNVLIIKPPFFVVPQASTNFA